MSVRLSVITCVLFAASHCVAMGQVLQLPTFHNFSVRTSVLAPDRGGTYLGGVGRSSSRSAAYGMPGAGRLPGVDRLFGNRALDHTAGGSNASVHVTVIDQEEMDRAVLAEAARRRSVPADPESTQRPTASDTDRGGTDQTLLSVAELRRQRAARASTAAGEAAQLFAQGQQAESRGQVGTARIYYRMAHKRATGQLQRDITARLAALEQPGS